MMIICKAPFRVSLFGGGSDHHDFINRYGSGLVVSFALDKYAYVSVKRLMPFFPYKSRITYSEVETVFDNRDIQHRVFKNCLDYMQLMEESIEINYTADLPGSIGLGTSSTMIVCMIEALAQYKYGTSMSSNKGLWAAASHVEHDMMGETVGLQDYLPAIWGGVRAYEITTTDVRPVSTLLDFKEVINRYGLLFYLQKTRNSSNVLSQYINKIQSNPQLKILEMAKQALKETDITTLGDMLNESWHLKKSLSPAVSTDQVDKVIDVAAHNGSLGAKLCGSGGGGCVFVLAAPDRHYNIIKAVEPFGALQIPFTVAPRGVERIL